MHQLATGAASLTIEPCLLRKRIANFCACTAERAFATHSLPQERLRWLLSLVCLDELQTFAHVQLKEHLPLTVAEAKISSRVMRVGFADVRGPCFNEA